MTHTRARCTQNPTMGEEWRKGWHPERIPVSGSEDNVLIVGGGPAGLECARALGQRGYAVTLAEAGTALGGRILGESRLPGMASYQRVVDHRLAAFHKLPNVETYLASNLSAEEVTAFEAQHIVLATGASWRRNGVGFSHRTALPIGALAPAIFTPDDIIAGQKPGAGLVLVYDDDRYIMAGLIAEKLAADQASAFHGHSSRRPPTCNRLADAARAHTARSPGPRARGPPLLLLCRVSLTSPF